MAQKLKQRAPDDLPGPGNYESKVEKGRAVRIAEKLPEDKIAEIPGPYRGHENWAPGFGYEVDYEVEFIPDYDVAEQHMDYNAGGIVDEDRSPSPVS